VKLNSGAIALILGICIGLITGAFLSLVAEFSKTGILIAVIVSFTSSFLLSYFVLEFIFFREIRGIYKLLDSIQANRNAEDRIQQLKQVLNPFKRINVEIENFASSKDQCNGPRI